MDHLSDWRLLYSRLLTSNLGIVDSENKILKAFEEVPREKFVGSGPWKIFTNAGYVETPTDAPEFIYQDVTIALDASDGINNGQPSLHAACLMVLGIKSGERILHIGSGSGYYTALLSKLTGPTGRVSAFEIIEALAERAKNNLSDFENVEVFHRSGTLVPMPKADVIYVNAGATEPMRVWLDALEIGGRLLFPLTPAQGVGGMLLVTRKSNDVFSARFIAPAMFIPCLGARDEDTGSKLTVAFRNGDWLDVRSLRIDTHPDDTAWVSGSNWWLSKE